MCFSDFYYFQDIEVFKKLTEILVDLLLGNFPLRIKNPVDT